MSKKKLRGWQVPVLWLLAVAALLMSSAAVSLQIRGSAALSVQPGDLLNFLGFSIGAVALVATVGFLVLAFPIWSEMSEIAEERKEISRAKEETEKIQIDIRRTLDDLNAPYSRFTDLYQSLQLFSLVIRYIGMPAADTTSDESLESESERIERHVSIVRHLMAAMSVDPERDTAVYLSLVRDAVGHLQASDDETFFEFIETRISAVRPREAKLQEMKQKTRQRFDIVRGNAAELRQT